MINSLTENNYLIIEDFITSERAIQLGQVFRQESIKNPQYFIQNDGQAPNSLSMHNWLPFVELLVEKVPQISQIVGEFVLPTYAYARVYSKGEILVPHTDRPACEISATVHLDGDKDWEIFFTKPNGEVASVILKPGQAVIYLGCISEHWRNAYQGEHYEQVFIHYIRSRGENFNHFFDLPEFEARLLNKFQIFSK